MEGLDKGSQGPISGCCAIEEEELYLSSFPISFFLSFLFFLILKYFTKMYLNLKIHSMD
jgi:hypothetical protein